MEQAREAAVQRDAGGVRAGAAGCPRDRRIFAHPGQHPRLLLLEQIGGGRRIGNRFGHRVHRRAEVLAQIGRPAARDEPLERSDEQRGGERHQPVEREIRGRERRRQAYGQNADRGIDTRNVQPLFDDEQQDENDRRPTVLKRSWNRDTWRAAPGRDDASGAFSSASTPRLAP